MKLALYTALAMLAFAANTVLCRVALVDSAIDPATFTSIRLISGAITLVLLVAFFSRPAVEDKRKEIGSWRASAALFTYAAAFSFAYVNIPTGTGAFLLFSSVQLFMLIHAIVCGTRLTTFQWIGMCIAFVGLIVLLLPGMSSPPLFEAVLMILAGCAWGVYSIEGKKSRNPLAATASNFLRTVPMVILLNIALLSQFSVDLKGGTYAMLSGVFASAIGYAIWYSVLPKLQHTSASVIQLSVPVLATFVGVLVLAEAITTQSIIASSTILIGILIVLLSKSSR